MIALQNIHYSTLIGKARVPVLKGLSLEIEPQEIMGIVGRSETAKSIVLRCFNLLNRPDTGKVWFKKTELMSLTAAQLQDVRLNIGMCLQAPNLLTSLSVFDNLALPLKLQAASRREIDLSVRPLLELGGLTHKRDALPRQLSNTEKQKVNILRALVHQPSVLLCDNLTLMLDTRASHSLSQLLQQLRTALNLTIVMTSTDLELLKSATSRIAVFSQGRIIEQGTTLGVLTQPQSEVAREFIISRARQEMPIVIKRQLSLHRDEASDVLARMSFLGDETHTEVLNQAANLFKLQVSIIQAHLETIQAQAVGMMLVEIKGEHSHIEQAMAYLNKIGLHGEILGYVPRAA